MRNLLFAVLVLCTAAASLAQQTYRTALAAANEALKKGDVAAYRTQATKVLELEHDRLGRPFYQYHLARAHALNGAHAEAIKSLEQIWTDGIEGGMLTNSEHDPAFVETRKLPAYAALLKRVDEAEIRVKPLGERIAQLEGAGCNLVLAWGPEGAVLVDSGYPRLGPAIARAIRKATGGVPLRFIINTHEHLDHVGGNVTLGRNVAVIAHPAAREALTKSEEFIHGFTMPPLAPAGLPNVLADQPLSLHLNGEEIRIVPLPAHAAGDVVVHFTKSNVVHMGDNFFPGSAARIFPGARVNAFFETFGPLVKSLPQEARIVSGHDDVVPLAKLREVYDNTESTYLFVKSGIAAGKSLETLSAEGEKAGHPPRWVRLLHDRLRKQ